MELLVVAAVIALVAGPRTLAKIFKVAKKANEVRTKLTPSAVLEQLMTEPEKKTGSKKTGDKTAKGDKPPAKKAPKDESA
jgi:Sec-independent protein translocase protein TatA